MSGAVTKKEILDIQGLDADRTNVIETLKAIAAAAVELSKTLGDTKGLKDLTAALKALNQVQAEFTIFQKQTMDMLIKAEQLKQQEAKTQIQLAKAIKETDDSTKKLSKSQKELISDEDKLDQKKIKSAEAQARINAMLKEEGVTWAKISAMMKDYIAATGSMAAAHSKMSEDWAPFRKKVKDATDEIKKNTQETKLNTQEEKLKLAVQAQSIGSIRRLQAENALHTFTIKNKLNPAIESEKNEILRLNQVISTNKDAISDMHRKNTNSWQRLTKSVLQYVSAYVGISQAIALVKNIFNLTKELDSLHFSMKTIIKDQTELNNTYTFLSDTAKNYGLDLLALSERYARFRAATMQSNMTAKETMTIFNSMAKISSVLGLRTDEVSGVFLALEQMISKGKVTTEELRRQLGERMPGAFGIMANAVQKLHPELVVTLASLDKMLKAGTIISSEVLPEFARQAEIAFGTETTTKVDTLAAAQGRLRTSWVQFVEETKQSKNFIYLLNNLNNALSGIRFAFGGANELELYSSLTGKWGDAFSKVTKEIDNLGGAGKDFFKDATTYHDMFINAMSKTGEPIEKLEKAWTQYVKKSKSMLSEETERTKKTTVFDPKSYKTNLEDTLNEIETFNETKDSSLKEAMKRTSDLFKSGSMTDVKYLNQQRNEIVKKSEEAWFKYNELQNKKNANEKAFTKDEEIELVARYDNYQGYIDARIAIDKKLKPINDENVKAEKKSKKEIEDITKAANDGLYIIAKGRQQQEEDDLKDFNDETKRLVKSAKDEQKKFTDETISDSIAEADKQKLRLQEVAIDEIKLAKGNKDEIEKIQHELTMNMIAEDLDAQQNILDTAGLEVEAYEDASIRLRRLMLQRGEEEIQFTQQTEEQKKQIRNETMQATNELLQQGLSFSQQIYSAQATRAQEAYDTEMNAAGDSLEYQTLAKRKFEAEDKKIKQRQAIAEKLSAVLTAGLNLALAIGSPNIFTKPLQIASATLGLVMALATPIPQFAEGTGNSPDMFIAGEKGSELIKTKSGKSILTPNSATLFSDPSLSGSTVIPNDETRRMLANMAFNQVREVVDLSDTNKHLASMDKQMKSKSERYTDSKGRTVVKRGNLVSTL